MKEGGICLFIITNPEKSAALSASDFGFPKMKRLEFVFC